MFWHGILCTGFAKIDNGRMMTVYIELFPPPRPGQLPESALGAVPPPRHGLLHWDNVDNHKGAINENYGRELLELFLPGGGDGRQVQLHRGRCEGGVPRLYRLERGAHHAGLPLRPRHVELPVRPHRPRRQREDFPRGDGPLEGRGYRGHCDAPARHGPLHLPPSVQFLRGRRAPGAGVEGHTAPGHGGHQDHGESLRGQRLRDALGAAHYVQLRFLQAGEVRQD